jgi:hypothetical protein
LPLADDLPSGFFFLWNSTMMGWVMVLYAALNNSSHCHAAVQPSAHSQVLERFERTSSR